MRRKMKKSLLLIGLVVFVLAACGGGATQGIEIAEVVFAKELSENYEPVNPTATFYPDEVINVSVTIPGRPKEGVLGAKFLYMDQLIAETSVDFADVNNDLLFSAGQKTFTGFFLTHEEPLYISPLYNVELLIDGTSAGKYAFSVIPPEDAIPTVVRDTIFALGVTEAIDPVDPKDVFSPSDAVHIIGQGDFGRLSYLQADWYLNGEELISDCTAGVPVNENLPDDRFYFSCELDAGWPAGTHSVVLTIDDVVVTEQTFSVE
jgi:hypothetical protein